jgi:hypothetical protein
MVKINQRFSGGVTLQGSYAYSRIMTDADSFSGSGGSLDAARPELEWSIGRFDIPHTIKLSSVFELPFGEGRRWLQSGIGNALLGGFRIAVIQTYNSGMPLGVTSNAPLPIFNLTNRPNVTGEDWRAPISGNEFDPTVDRFLNPAAFAQPVGALGNAPRINGDVRRPWDLNENMSVAKSIRLSPSLSMDVRFEAFNLFNRVVWGAPNQNFSSNTFGIVSTQNNAPRRMQLGLKLYW